MDNNLKNIATVQNIETEKLQSFVDGLIEERSTAYNSKNGQIEETISEWFKQYAISDEFAKLPKEKKLRAFNQFENLEFLLHKINHFLEKNSLGNL